MKFMKVFCQKCKMKLPIRSQVGVFAVEFGARQNSSVKNCVFAACRKNIKLKSQEKKFSEKIYEESNVSTELSSLSFTCVACLKLIPSQSKKNKNFIRQSST